MTIKKLQAKPGGGQLNDLFYLSYITPCKIERGRGIRIKRIKRIKRNCFILFYHEKYSEIFGKNIKAPIIRDDNAAIRTAPAEISLIFLIT